MNKLKLFLTFLLTLLTLPIKHASSDIKHEDVTTTTKPRGYD